MRSKTPYPQSKPRTVKISSSSMASSSSVPESIMQEIAQGTSTQQETPAYEIKGRTMSFEEWELTLQVESPLDFTSLLWLIMAAISRNSTKLRTFYTTLICLMVQPI